MIPHKLMMSAFGPYKGEQPVDFDKFEGKGLFLITGETGAGKTTIFDGLTYALYGKLTGDRTPEDFRCKYAEPNTLTFVVLEFTQNGRRYKVTRTPKQERPVKKGTGTTIQDATAQLESEGMTALTKTKDVDKKLEEILGIDYDQWKQVAMLAQGEFRKLLTADTDTRTNTLRSIFSTKALENFQDELSNKANALRAQYKVAKETLDSSINSVTLPEDSPYIQELESAKATSSVDDVLNIISLQTGVDNDKVNLLAKEISELDDQKTELSKQIGEAEKINNLFKDLNEKKNEKAELDSQKPEYDELDRHIKDVDSAVKTFKIPRQELKRLSGEIEDGEKKVGELQSKIDKLNADLTTAKDEQTTAHGRDPELRALVDEIAVINSKRGTYDEIEELNKELSTLKQRRDETASKRDELLKEKTEFDEKVTENRRFQADNEHAGETLISLDNEAKSFDTDKKNLESLDKRCEEYLKEEKTNASLRADAESARIELEKKKGEYASMESEFYATFAGRIAQTLKEGEPCPVCGSVHHDHPAELKKGAVTQSDLETCKSDLNGLQDGYNKANAKLEASNTKLGSALREITDAANESKIEGTDVPGIRSAIAERVKTITENINDRETKVKELKPIVDKVNEVREWLKNSDSKRGELEKSFSDADTKTRDAETAYNNMDTKLKEKSSGLKYASIEELDSVVKGKEKAKKAIEEQIATADRKVQDIDKNIESSKGSLQIAQETLSSNREQHAQRNFEYQKLLESHEISDETVAQRLSCEDTLESDKERLVQYRDKVKDAESAIATLEKSVEGKAVLDLVEMQKRLQSLRDDSAAKSNLKNDITIRISKYGESSTAICRAKKEYDSLGDESKDIILLDEIASGKKGIKLSFESYIQGVYFRMVLTHGNLRLLKLTDGRYSMRIRKVDKNKSKVGLDIDIHDNHYGTTRPANTLSGGESFKAALALALGLSDAVMSMKGGIHIDTLFVDEGFGTLDKESFRDSIDLLRDLSKSNTLIGIISHMEELKEEIDHKITVSKVEGGLSGSEAKVSTE